MLTLYRLSILLVLAASLTGLLAGCGNGGDAPLPDGTASAETPQGAPGSAADDTARPAPGQGDPAAQPAPGAGVGAGDGDAAGTTAVEVWFTRGETPEAVTRQVDRGAPAAAAFSALLAGPTQAERDRGLFSWFSDETARSLRGVDLRDGFLVVDFEGLDRLIPNASSSTGSSILLATLDSTAFQFEAVDSVEYRLGGSCEAFWNWLQRSCGVTRRP